MSPGVSAYPGLDGHLLFAKEPFVCDTNLSLSLSLSLSKGSFYRFLCSLKFIIISLSITLEKFWSHPDNLFRPVSFVSCRKEKRKGLFLNICLIISFPRVEYHEIKDEKI